MIVCPNCGNANPDGSRFCANCGADLSAPARGAAPAPEPAPAAGRTTLPPTSPEWRMSPAGPLPEPPRRRRWIWIVLGILGACVVICVVLFVLVGSGAIGPVNDFMTAVEATRQAGS